MGLGYDFLVDYLTGRFSRNLLADGIEVFWGDAELVGIELHCSAIGVLMQDAHKLSEKYFCRCSLVSWRGIAALYKEPNEGICKRFQQVVYYVFPDLILW